MGNGLPLESGIDPLCVPDIELWHAFFTRFEISQLCLTQLKVSMIASIFLESRKNALQLSISTLKCSVHISTLLFQETIVRAE